MTTLRQIATAAALATTAALAAAPASQAAPVPCFKTFNGAGSGWKVQNDGSLMQPLLQGGASALDEDHGKLTIDGAAYPKLAGNQCTQTATRLQFPTVALGTFLVTRSVAEIGGTLRWIDTIYNNGPGQMATVDFGLEVLPSQLIQTSESGNDTVNSDDHWSVHKSQNLYSIHQWGQDGAPAEPTVVPEDGGNVWEDDFGTMDDDATLRYSFFLAGGQTVRLLHAASTSSELPASVAMAQNAARLFEGVSQTTAAKIVNFGDDPDGDGVKKHQDYCPAVAGDGADGCPLPVVPEPPAEPENPQNGDGQGGQQGQPAGNEQPQGPGTAPGADHAAPSGAAPLTDTMGPVVSITKLGHKVRRSALTGRGAQAKIRCTEACRFVVKLKVKQRGRKRERTLQTITRSGYSTDARLVRFKVSQSGLKKLAKQRVTVVVEATDRAGNRTTQRRTVGLR